jgi:hypothetical protein
MKALILILTILAVTSCRPPSESSLQQAKRWDRSNSFLYKANSTSPFVYLAGSGAVSGEARVWNAHLKPKGGHGPLIGPAGSIAHTSNSITLSGNGEMSGFVDLSGGLGKATPYKVMRSDGPGRTRLVSITPDKIMWVYVTFEYTLNDKRIVAYKKEIRLDAKSIHLPLPRVSFNGALKDVLVKVHRVLGAKNSHKNPGKVAASVAVKKIQLDVKWDLLD